MSARNRELANLIVVGILTALGFASVYIARQEVVSTASLSYAGFFFALYLAAHLVARLAVPFADPYLLPMAGLLTGIGLTEIYRLNPSDAFRQGLWIVVALGRVLGHAVRAAPRLPAARELQVPLRPDGDRAARPACSARARHLGQRRAPLGARRLAPVPAGRAREDVPDRLPRRVPAREARGAGAGPPEGLRAAARDLGRRDARPRRDERPRERAPLLRDLPGDALRRDRPAALRRARRGPLPRAARSASTTSSRTCATA